LRERDEPEIFRRLVSGVDMGIRDDRYGGTRLDWSGSLLDELIGASKEEDKRRMARLAARVGLDETGLVLRGRAAALRARKSRRLASLGIGMVQ
jgi:hypothetical protein